MKIVVIVILLLSVWLTIPFVLYHWKEFLFGFLALSSIGFLTVGISSNAHNLIFFIIAILLGLTAYLFNQYEKERRKTAQEIINELLNKR